MSQPPLTPFGALRVLLRSAPLRSAALARARHRLRQPLEAIAFHAVIVGGATALSVTLTFLLLAAPYAVGRAWELSFSPPPKAERLFYAADPASASPAQWALAEQALGLGADADPEDRLSARASPPERSGPSLMGLSPSEREAILLAARRWRARADANDLAHAQRAAALLIPRSEPALSGQLLLAAHAMLAVAPERAAVESVERAALSARPIDGADIPAWERLRVGDLQARPLSALAVAEWQALSSRHGILALKGLALVLLGLALAALAWLGARAARRLAHNASPEFLREWERQSIEDATGGRAPRSKASRL